MLDLNLGQISFWLNSRMLKKNKMKELKKRGLTWYPYIRLQEELIPVILNPFCRQPMADNMAPKFRQKLPQSLEQLNLSHSRVQYLKQQISGRYLLLQIPKVEDEQLIKYIKEVQKEANIDEIFCFPSKEN